MGFFSRIFGLSAFSALAGAAANNSSKGDSFFPSFNTTHAERILRGDKNASFCADFQKYRLAEVLNLAEDVAVFRFLLRDPEHVFDLPACSTLQLGINQGKGGNDVERPVRAYTPVTPTGTKGYFDILVKKQPNGKVTENLWGMEVGDFATFRLQMFKMQYKPNKYEHIGMIAGGTGVTVMMQMIRPMVANPDDQTKMSLLYTNASESKILLRGQLEELQKKSNGRFDMNLVINKTDETNEKTWKGYTGYITQEMVKKHMPAVGDKNTLVMLCGPDKMMNSLCGSPMAQMAAMHRMGGPSQGSGSALVNLSSVLNGTLGGLGYNGDQVYRF